MGANPLRSDKTRTNPMTDKPFTPCPQTVDRIAEWLEAAISRKLSLIERIQWGYICLAINTSRVAAERHNEAGQ